jgi:hypothetical protein
MGYMPVHNFEFCSGVVNVFLEVHECGGTWIE